MFFRFCFQTTCSTCKLIIIPYTQNIALSPIKISWILFFFPCIRLPVNPNFRFVQFAQKYNPVPKNSVVAVYRIPCLDCPKSYAGKICQLLMTRAGRSTLIPRIVILISTRPQFSPMRMMIENVVYARLKIMKEKNYCYPREHFLTCTYLSHRERFVFVCFVLHSFVHVLRALNELVKGMLYPPGNSELMCDKLPTIPREIFWKFGLNFVPIIIMSHNQTSVPMIDPIHNHTKFHKVRSNTWADFHTTNKVTVVWK